jgi:hypothetical protein
MRKILIRVLFGHTARTPAAAVLSSGSSAAVAGLLALAMGPGGCSRAPAEELSPAPTSTSTSHPTPAPASSSGASAPASTPGPGLRWDDPSRWRRRPVSSPMRVAEYVVPRAAGDTADAECTVITFGPSQGGSVSDNVDRWVRQFNPLSGPPTKATRRAGGMAVTRVEVAGSYHPMSMPGGPQAPTTLQGARLLGAIVEAPSGLWFFKLTGPDASVRAAAPDLDALIDSVRAP